MKISERYRITNDEMCVILEENKEITPKKDKDNPSKVLETRLEWKPIAYFANIESAIKHVMKKELIKGSDLEAKEILEKIKELREELPNISAKIYKEAKVFKKQEVKLNKTKKQKSIIEEEIELEIEYHNDFLNDREREDE